MVAQPHRRSRRATITSSRTRNGRRFWLYREGLFERETTAPALVRARTVRVSAMTAYAELAVTTNFSFLRGASHPQEMVMTARALGLAAIGIADRNSLRRRRARL